MAGGISVMGMGSGLDINNLVSGLVEAEAAPQRSRLDKSEARLTTELSAVGTLKGALADFQDTVLRLNSTSKFQTIKATVGDDSLLGASAIASAQPASYAIEIEQLAQAQKLASETFAEVTSTVGTGTLTFSFGSYDGDNNTFTANVDRPPQTVTIDASNNTLAGVRDAINQADIGVQASIINDGTGYRLVTTATDTGAANGLKISVADGDGNDLDTAGLSQLAFDPTAGAGSGKNLTQTVAALDAKLWVDGIQVTGTSNTLAGVVQGVTLNLKSAQPGTTTTLNVAHDTGKVTELLEGFVESYNELIGTIDNLTRFDPASGDKGPLLGDAGARTIVSQLRSIIGARVPGAEEGTLRSLADLGIITQRDGTLGLDQDKLAKAIQLDPEGIAPLFARGGRSSDPLVAYAGAGTDTQAGTYDVNITQLASRGSYLGVAHDATWVTLFGWTIDGDTDTLALKVDGVQSDTITLEQKDYGSGTALAAALQTQINADSNFAQAGVSVLVNYDDASGAFSFTSARYGAASRVEFTGVDTATESRFGFGPGVSGATLTDGLDVAGTIGGVAASGDGQRLTGSGQAAGIRLDILGGATGSRGTVSLTAGVAERLDDLLDGLLKAGGSLTSRTDSLNQRLGELGDERLELARRLETIEARYRAQFIAMDSLVGQLTSMGNYLRQQMDSLIEAYKPQ
ncbi:MAG: flagellar filament capping protein FliD [Candidatus Competibacteraceae bacterium]|nr:flagellar filament capping protein FliD [Candidatus Competibacteraceae bacterium]